MEQTILQLPMQSPEPPALGHIIGVIYQQPQPPLLPVIQQVGEEPDGQEQDVQDWELNKVQRDSLEALTIFHNATAELLLRYLKLSPNSIDYLQKHLKELCPKAEEEERFIEISAAPKQKESRFGS